MLWAGARLQERAGATERRTQGAGERACATSPFTTGDPQPGAGCVSACAGVCVCARGQVRLEHPSKDPAVKRALSTCAAGHLEWAVCSARSWNGGPRRMMAWKGTSGPLGLLTATAPTPHRAGQPPPSPTSPTTTASPLSQPVTPSLEVAMSRASQVSGGGGGWGAGNRCCLDIGRHWAVREGRHGLDPRRAALFPRLQWLAMWGPPRGWIQLLPHLRGSWWRRAP